MWKRKIEMKQIVVGSFLLAIAVVLTVKTHFLAVSMADGLTRQTSIVRSSSTGNFHPEVEKRAHVKVPYGASKDSSSKTIVHVGDHTATTVLPAFVHDMFGPGFGSNIMNMFIKHIYKEDTQNRTGFIVDESIYPYRWNETTGFFRGYFTPQFPIIDSPAQYPMIQKYFPPGYIYNSSNVSRKGDSLDHSNSPIFYNPYPGNGKLFMEHIHHKALFNISKFLPLLIHTHIYKFTGRGALLDPAH